jgi:hypothetical protein
MRNHREADIQMALCKYVRLKYPKSIFNVDLSGVNLSKTASGMAKMMRSSKNFPDFVLYEMRHFYPKDTLIPKIYGALFIELKAEGTKLGSYVYENSIPEWHHANDHIKEQAEMIDALTLRGYKAMFCVGLDSAMKSVDDYMNLKL